MTQTVLNEILKKHCDWLNGKDGGERADLSNANLRYANLRCANLRYADLSGANLSGADLSDADLSKVNLSNANLSGADLSNADLSKVNLSNANLSGADLSNANLSKVNLSNANLSGADLSNADLIGANLSNAENLLNAINFMETHFEKTDEGYIVYKTFNDSYVQNPNWEIKENSIIEEVVNHIRTQSCGCGINVAPLAWVKRNYPNKQIYKLLIKFEWLTEVCVPYNSNGKIRCGRAKIIEKVNN